VLVVLPDLRVKRALMEKTERRAQRDRKVTLVLPAPLVLPVLLVLRVLLV
jgi:hypothetical protein